MVNVINRGTYIHTQYMLITQSIISHSRQFQNENNVKTYHHIFKKTTYFAIYSNLVYFVKKVETIINNHLKKNSRTHQNIRKGKKIEHFYCTAWPKRYM